MDQYLADRSLYWASCAEKIDDKGDDEHDQADFHGRPQEACVSGCSSVAFNLPPIMFLLNSDAKALSSAPQPREEQQSDDHMRIAAGFGSLHFSHRQWSRA